ncbi:MAG: GNAT family N-acetyltransferase, partial [Planctomycetes bacterium]|nr:GNAT family N-acetyltransferase [Planctomycetota bacterium]
MTDPLPQPTLHTERLTLRPFVVEDASAVQRLAGSRLVAATVPVIPHPYLDGMAEGWIATHADAWRDRKSVSFAIE